MANFVFGLIFLVLAVFLVEESLSTVGGMQFLEMVGAAVMLGAALLCFLWATTAAIASVRWRWHRAQWRSEGRRAAPR